MSEPVDAMAPTENESPTTVTSKVPFDAPAVEPPKMDESKPSRMKFLRRKVKSRDEDEEDDDEAEIKRLEKKVELLKKKKQLVMKIKQMERGIETGEPDSDEETTLNKQSGSPKRWPSLKPRRWKWAKDDSDDELTYDDDSPLLTRFHSALDCIETGCDPVINEIVDLNMMCMDGTSKERDESLYTRDIEDTETVERNAAPTFSADNEERKTEDVDGFQVASLAAPIVMLAKTMSQNFTRADENADKSNEAGKESDRKNEESGTETAAQANEVNQAKDNEAGWIDRAATVLRSRSFAHKTDDNDLGLDCFAALSSQSRTETANEQSSELDAKFSKVIVTVMALSGLSITSKKGGKSTDQDGVPPVQVVLSVIKNEEGKPFVHIPSMCVIKDPSRASTKKNSAKYHVMGVWDTAQGDSTSGDTKSSVSFSRLVGLSTLESDAETKPDKETEMKMSPSMIHLRICIKRDGSNELLPIGVAKVLVSGGPRNVELAVPLRPEYYRSMEELVKKLNAKPPESKWEALKTFVLEDEEEILTCARFKGFKNETYRLEKDSFVRINLTVTPEDQDETQPKPLSSLFLNDSDPSPVKNDDAKSTAEATAMISNSAENPSSENEARATQSSSSGDGGSPADEKLDEKVKKSWFRKNKRAVEAEKNEAASEDDGKVASAAIVGGGTAALALAASSHAENTDINSDDDALVSGESTNQTSNSSPPETEKASPSNTKKSWFKKGDKTNARDAKTGSSDKVAAAATVGTGIAAVALSMPESSEQQTDEAISKQDEVKVPATHIESEISHTFNDDVDSLHPGKETPTNKNNKSWFKRGQKVKMTETGSDSRLATAGIADGAVATVTAGSVENPAENVFKDHATTHNGVEIEELSFKGTNADATQSDVVPTAAVEKSKKTWFIKSTKAKEESTKRAELSSNTSLIAAAGAATIGTVALAALKSANDAEEPSCELKQVEKDIIDASAPSAVDGIESPIFKETDISDDKPVSSSEKECGDVSAPKRGMGWFKKKSRPTKLETSQASLLTDSNKSAKPEPAEMPYPERYEKASDTETSQAPADDAHAELETEVIFEGGAADENKEQATNKSQCWGLKSLRPKKNKDSRAASSGRAEEVEDNGDFPSVGAAAIVGATAVAGVGLKNQNVFGSDTSFEVLQSAEDEMNPVVVGVDDVETPCFCNVNEMMETDMPTDVAEGANCIKEGDVSLASDEFEKTEDLYGDDEEDQDNLIDNISVVNDMEQYGDHYDLSECSCEDCLVKRDKSDDQMEEECEGIELELKPKLEKIEGDCDRPKMKTRKSLKKVSGLAGKLSRSKSRRVQ